MDWVGITAVSLFSINMGLALATGNYHSTAGWFCAVLAGLMVLNHAS